VPIASTTKAVPSPIYSLHPNLCKLVPIASTTKAVPSPAAWNCFARPSFLGTFARILSQKQENSSSARYLFFLVLQEPF
jgi:hypothetical protein